MLILRHPAAVSSPPGCSRVTFRGSPAPHLGSKTQRQWSEQSNSFEPRPVFGSAMVSPHVTLGRTNRIQLQNSKPRTAAWYKIGFSLHAPPSRAVRRGKNMGTSEFLSMSRPRPRSCGNSQPYLASMQNALAYGTPLLVQIELRYRYPRYRPGLNRDRSIPTV